MVSYFNVNLNAEYSKEYTDNMKINNNSIFNKIIRYLYDYDMSLCQRTDSMSFGNFYYIYVIELLSRLMQLSQGMSNLLSSTPVDYEWPV